MGRRVKHFENGSSFSWLIGLLPLKAMEPGSVLVGQISLCWLHSHLWGFIQLWDFRANLEMKFLTEHIVLQDTNRP